MNENLTVLHNACGMGLPVGGKSFEVRAVDYEYVRVATPCAQEHFIARIEDPHRMADTRETHEKAEERHCLMGNGETGLPVRGKPCVADDCDFARDSRGQHLLDSRYCRGRRARVRCRKQQTSSTGSQDHEIVLSGFLANAVEGLLDARIR